MDDKTRHMVHAGWGALGLAHETIEAYLKLGIVYHAPRNFAPYFLVIFLTLSCMLMVLRCFYLLQAVSSLFMFKAQAKPVMHSSISYQHYLGF
jgi:hypothetical protein